MFTGMGEDCQESNNIPTLTEDANLEGRFGDAVLLYPSFVEVCWFRSSKRCIKKSVTFFKDREVASTSFCSYYF